MKILVDLNGIFHKMNYAETDEEYDYYEELFEKESERLPQIIKDRLGSTSNILWYNPKYDEYQVRDFWELLDFMVEKYPVDLLELDNGNLALKSNAGIGELIGANLPEETIKNYIPDEEYDDWELEDADDTQWESFKPLSINKKNITEDTENEFYISITNDCMIRVYYNVGGGFEEYLSGTDPRYFGLSDLSVSNLVKYCNSKLRSGWQQELAEYSDLPFLVSLKVEEFLPYRRGIGWVATAITNKVPTEIEKAQLSRYIISQMSDGWGEGFEQQTIYEFRDDAPEENDFNDYADYSVEVSPWYPKQEQPVIEYDVLEEDMFMRKKKLKEGLLLSVNDFDGDKRDLLDAYLNWEGITGYTNDIMSIIEDGEIYVHSMDEEDLQDIKRRYGLYENKNKPHRKSLKESTEEIDRKLFGSLIKYSDPVFAGANYGVLNDGVLVYKFWARDDEDAKKVFQKYGVKNKPNVDTQGYAILESITWNDLSRNEFVYEINGLDNNWKYIKFFQGSNDIYDDDIPEGEDVDDYNLVYYEIYNSDKEEIDGGEMISKEKSFEEDSLIRNLLELSGLVSDSSLSFKRLADDFLNESLIKESRQLNEGPGAGYTISGKVGDVRIGDITITEDKTDNAIYYGVEGNIELDLVNVKCESYYYGGEIPETTVRVEWLGLSAEEDWELSTPTENDIYELLIGLDFETVYGGGWSHSAFDNDLELDYNDINYSSASYDIDKLEIKFTDPRAVDAIDKYATGENYDVEYSVMDDDNYEVEYFDNKEDAIEYAKKEGYPFVAETHWGWEYLGNDEYNTTDRVDSSEIIWTNEELRGEK